MTTSASWPSLPGAGPGRAPRHDAGGNAGDDLGPKLVAGVAMSFTLIAAQLFHSVLDSILMFTGLLGGLADYTWADWAGALAWSGLGNLVGGIGLVTSLRLLQTPHRVAEERTDQG